MFHCEFLENRFIYFQERHLYNLGGRDFKDSLRTVGAALLCPDLQGHYNLTGNRKASNKSSFLKLIEVHRTMYSKLCFLFVCLFV